MAIVKTQDQSSGEDVWRTQDGQEFYSAEEAAAHDAQLDAERSDARDGSPAPAPDVEFGIFDDTNYDANGQLTPEGYDLIRENLQRVMLTGTQAESEAARQSLANMGPRPGGNSRDLPTVDSVLGGDGEAAPAAFGDVLNPAPAVTGYEEGSPSGGVSRAPAGIDTSNVLRPGETVFNTTSPGDAAPELDRTNIDPILSKLDSQGNFIYGLSQQGRNFDKAEAFLNNAAESARRATLGVARGGRSRADRALLERQAIGEGSAIQQQLTRDAAELRAEQEDSDRTFALQAASKAAELGLNSAALEIDVSRANLDSVTNLINQQFGQLGIDKQIDQRQAEAALNFARDMALIQFDYDKLSVEDQNATDALMMQRYGIDQQTMVALKQLKQQGEFDWGGLASGLVTGFAGGAGAVATKALIASDPKAKTNVKPAGRAELDALLSSLKPKTFEYTPESGEAPGTNLGVMSTDLAKSPMGADMVFAGEDELDGFDKVSVPKAAMAALSGLAMLNDRLAKLEQGVK